MRGSRYYGGDEGSYDSLSLGDRDWCPLVSRSHVPCVSHDPRDGASVRGGTCVLTEL